VQELTSTARGGRTPLHTPQELGVMISNSSSGFPVGSTGTIAVGKLAIIRSTIQTIKLSHDKVCSIRSAQSSVQSRSATSAAESSSTARLSDS
jgi:hypothetical protein